MSEEKKEEILGKAKEMEAKELETKELETVVGGENGGSDQEDARLRDRQRQRRLV